MDANEPRIPHQLGIDPRNIEVIDDETAAALKRLTGDQRVAMLDEMDEFARNIARGRVRFLHPDWSDEQVEREAIRRLRS